MASIDHIKSQTWGISIVGYGVIVEGIASIKQCIRLVLSTRKNTDPLRPTFGSNIFNYIDQPVWKAIPNIKSEIINSLSQWEPRIKLGRITHSFKSPSVPVFNIEFTVIDENIKGELSFSLAAGEVSYANTEELTIFASFPTNPENYPYQLHFLINGSGVLPNSQNLIFESSEELKSWVISNWQYIGRWSILQDRLVVNLPADGVNNATLQISLFSIKSLKAEYPIITAHRYYIISFLRNGQIIQSNIPLITPVEVVDWLRQNHSDVATWENSQAPPLPVPLFSTEFSTEFEIDTVYIPMYLICRPAPGSELTDLQIQVSDL